MVHLNKRGEGKQGQADKQASISPFRLRVWVRISVEFGVRRPCPTLSLLIPSFCKKGRPDQQHGQFYSSFLAVCLRSSSSQHDFRRMYTPAYSVASQTHLHLQKSFAFFFGICTLSGFLSFSFWREAAFEPPTKKERASAQEEGFILYPTRRPPPPLRLIILFLVILLRRLWSGLTPAVVNDSSSMC